MKAARVFEKELMIPTYDVGKEEKNPMFFEKRVYQGSSGRVYPNPVIEKIEDVKKDRVYRAVILENDYVEVTVLPELGGRIYSARDKSNGYDFVYRNHVIKPALVGLLGPWISGDIEFNWPQHHRPSTYMPVRHQIKNNLDGSACVTVGGNGKYVWSQSPNGNPTLSRCGLYRNSHPDIQLWQPAANLSVVGKSGLCR